MQTSGFDDPGSSELNGNQPSLDELRSTARLFRVALSTRFRSVTHREGVLWEGPNGWAEFAPFDDYDDVGAARWLKAAVEQGWGRWPTPVRDVVPVNAIIPAVDAELAAAMTADAIARGCMTMKVKVGGSESDQTADVARLRAVRARLQASDVADARIRIDVNTGWSVDDSRTYLPQLAEAAEGLEYVEQPCRTLAECAQVRALGIAPVAIDEGIRLAADFLDADLLRGIAAAADVVILKPIPLGGVATLLQLAERLQKPVVVSSSMDTSVGLAAGVAAAAALPQLDYACGLGTGALLAEDVCAQSLLPVDGRLQPMRPQASPSLVERVEMRDDDQRRDYWLNRLSGAFTSM